MTKRFLIALIAFTLSLPLLAIEPHRAALTEDGTFYWVDVVMVDEGAIPANSLLQLNAQDNQGVESSVIPGSDKIGSNFEPSVAWDETGDTLFVFWVHMPSMMATEILFTSYHNGEWSEVISIDRDTFHYRKNLRIATTRYHLDLDEEGNEVMVPGTAIHAVWWDEDGWGETAQYAILAFEEGAVKSIERFSLVDLIDRSEQERSALPPGFNRAFFEVPTITPHPSADGVEVIFGDLELDVLHKIDIIPIRADGVLTIPTGVRGSEPIRPTFQFENSTISDLEFLSGGAKSGQIAAVWRENGSMVFSRYIDGNWSQPKSVLLNDRVSRDHVVQGLRRLLGRH